MERFFKLFNHEFTKISEAAFVLGLFTLLSQLLGIVRDRILAGQIGPGSILDSYYAAFRVPDLLFTLGAALVSVSVLMPFFTEKIGEGRGRKFIDEVFTSFFFFITITAVVSAVLMPLIARSSLVGFDTETMKNTILLSRIMLLSPILLGISSLLSTVTQTFKKFFVYALAPVFYNLGIIVGIACFYPIFGITGLAYGVVLGAILHVLIQIPVVIKEGYFPRFTGNIDWKNIGTILKLSLPRTITLSASKIMFLVFVSIASTLETGAISVFNMSFNLQSVPLALIGVSYSVAAFPTLVEYYNGKKFKEFMEHVIIPIRQIIFWSMPIIALFIVLRAQIVRVILGTGNFDWSDTRLTAATLAIFIISVVAQSIILLLIRAYYAAGLTWKPLWITAGTSILSIGLALIFKDIYLTYPNVQHFFEHLLRIENVPGSSVTMLALSYSIENLLNFWGLWYAFKRDFNYEPIFNISKTTWQSISASVLIGVVAYLGLQVLDPLFTQTKVLHVFAHGFLAGVMAIIVGIAYLLLIKNQEIGLLIGAASQRLAGSRKIVTEGEGNM